MVNVRPVQARRKIIRSFHLLLARRLTAPGSSSSRIRVDRGVWKRKSCLSEIFLYPGFYQLAVLAHGFSLSLSCSSFQTKGEMGSETKGK